MRIFDRLPPVFLVMVGIVSVNTGATVAKSLFAALGPDGVVFLRAAFAALVLQVLARPDWCALDRRQWRAVAIFGFVLALMNVAFYQSLQRLPIGLCVTIEFIGPLSVALWHSHRRLDLLWVALAAFGIVLLNPFSGELDALGVLLALVAGACWAAYIVLGQRLGNVLPSSQGLAMSMAFAALFIAPVGLQDALPAFTDWQLCLSAFGVALLSSVLPYSFEIEALRRMSAKLFGILLSLEPAVAAVCGWLWLSEDLTWIQMVAMLAVIAASYGAARYSQPAAH